jgi:hypothetical protein
MLNSSHTTFFVNHVRFLRDTEYLRSEGDNLEPGREVRTIGMKSEFPKLHISILPNGSPHAHRKP